jgi:hypothetical protein
MMALSSIGLHGWQAIVFTLAHTSHQYIRDWNWTDESSSEHAKK